MNSITIQIAGKDYLIKTSLRALMLFEDLTGKNINNLEDSINNTITLFYCIVKASNKDFNYSLDEFIDLLEDNQESIQVFTEFLTNQQNQQKPDKKKAVKK